MKANKGFQTQHRRNEHWTVDPFWEVDRPLRQQHPNEKQPGPSSQNEQVYHEYIPMEEGEIGSLTDQDSSTLEVPAFNWAKYVGVKSVQSIMMSHAPKVDEDVPNNWALGNEGNAVRETDKKFFTNESSRLTHVRNNK